MNVSLLAHTPEWVLMVVLSLEQDRMYVPNQGMLSACGQDVLTLLTFVQEVMPAPRESVCQLLLEISKYYWNLGSQLYQLSSPTPHVTGTKEPPQILLIRQA